MTNREQAFLSLVALGWFSVDSRGRVWRHRELVGGSKVGAPSCPRAVHPPRRAEKSRSKYLKILFRSPEGRKAVYAHRVVWMMTNQEDIPAGMEVNHKDGNKLNNNPDNLELLTHTGNILHSFQELGRRVKEQRGEKNTSAKLDEAKVLEIRALCAGRRLPQSKIAKMFKVSQGVISNIHLRITWKHVP